MKTATTEQFMKLLYGSIKQKHRQPNEKNARLHESFIVEKICYLLSVEEDQLKEKYKSRVQKYVWARYLHIYARRKYFLMTYQEAGSAYNFGHSNAMSAVKTVDRMLKYDRQFKNLTLCFFELIKQ